MAKKQDESILDFFNLDERGNPKQAAPQVDALDELQKRLTALEDENRRLRQTSQALQTAAPRVQQDIPAPPKLDLTDGLPDYVSDPEGFNRALAERVSAYTNGVVEHRDAQRNAAAQQQNDIKAKTDRLWKGFTEKYESLKDQTELVEFAAGRVLAEKQAQGLDIERYAFTSSEDFYEDVAKRVYTLNPALAPKQDTDPFNRDVPEGRTAGVFGGQESGGRPAEQSRDVPGDFIADVKALQKIGGFF